LTPDYSDSLIRELHEQFISLKRYRERLVFYDTHFNIIPFQFPEFSPDLDIFTDGKLIADLIGIFKQERNNPGLNKKLFTAGNLDYVFDIKPTNSNNPLYNEFILAKFQSINPCPEQYLKAGISKFKTDPNPLEKLLVLANERINSLECQIAYHFDKSYLQNFMAVFYKGVLDGFSKKRTPSSKKSKYIVLYLYSYGYQYGRYLKMIRCSQAFMKTYGFSKLFSF
jgi:hypothetical protein